MATFNSDREALRELVDRVRAFGRTEEGEDDQAERNAMFDAADEARHYLEETEPKGNESD